MDDPEPIVAVSFLTERDLRGLGGLLRNVYRLDTDHDFDGLIRAIDRADRQARPKMPPVR